MDKELWNEFKNGEKIAVNCKTEKEAEEFLKMCDKEGLEWFGGDSLTDNNCWNTYKESTCYSNECDVQIASEKYNRAEGCKIITYTELMEGSKEELKLNNNEKLEKLIKLGVRKKEHEEKLNSLTEMVNYMFSCKNHTVEIVIGSDLEFGVSIKATDDVINLLINNEKRTLSLIIYAIDNLLNGDANKLKDKINELSNSIKEDKKELL